MVYRENEELSKRPRSPNSQRQTNLPLVAEEDARGEAAEAYDFFRTTHFGRPDVPGILKCFATHPPLLRHMMNLSEALIFADGALSRRQKEMIATLISAVNGCAYCADSHGFFLSVHGGSEETVRSLLKNDLDTAALEPRERLLLEFTQKVTGNAAEINPEDTAALRKAGWNNQQIAEAIHVTALFACFNRVASAFGLTSQNLFSLGTRGVETERPAGND